MAKCSQNILGELHNIFELVELNYVLPDQSYLLKLSKEEQSTTLQGNEKSNYFITSKTINTQQYSYGIEFTNKTRLQFTMSFPIMSNEKIVAYVEVITELWDIIHTLEETNDTALFMFIEKQCVTDVGATQAYINDYTKRELTAWEYLDEHIMLYGDASQLGKEQKAFFDQDNYLKKEKLLNYKEDGYFLTAGHFSLLDVRGKPIGHIGLISNNTVDMQIIHQLLMRFVISV